MAGFMCDIVTPVAKLVSDEVELVVVPGVEGEMGFLKGLLRSCRCLPTARRA